MIDVGNEVHLGPIDIRKKIMLWTLEPPTIIRKKGDFSGGPMAKIPCSQCKGPGFDPWLGNQTQHASTRTQHSQVNIFLKD